VLTASIRWRGARLGSRVRIHNVRSVVSPREPNMLRGSFASETRLSGFSVMGKQHWSAHRTDLTYRVIPTEQGKSTSLPARGKCIARWTDGGADNR